MPWRRWWLVLAQVCFLRRDLHRKMDIYAFPWRRYRPYFRTCAKNTRHLCQEYMTPAPTLRKWEGSDGASNKG